MGKTLQLVRLASPVGELLAGASTRGIALLTWVDAVARFKISAAELVPAQDCALVQLQEELDEYFAGARESFSVPVDLGLSTAFRAEVQRELSNIAYGTTVSYAQLAARVGRPRAVRAVASACANNPVAIVLPCHRVVAATSIGGYLGGASAKNYLLELEARRQQRNA